MAAKFTISLVWRGDPSAPDAPTRYEERLRPIEDALRARGFDVRGVKYFDDRVEEARALLEGSEGVLVWVNPIAAGEERTRVDALLREAGARGAWVSAHPDVIAKMGVKEVLHRTRDFTWGSDCELHESLGDFERAFPEAAERGARVLKPSRGNDGQGVMRVSRNGDAFDVHHASSGVAEKLSFAELCAALAPVFSRGARIVDQECHPTHTGMVRCYMSGPRVVGFSIQLPRAPDAFTMQASKEMHGANYQPFADLRIAMEGAWTPAMLRTLQMEERDLPAIWDADFLWRASPARGCRFALCEINVSCVSPFPSSAPAAIADWAARTNSR